MIIRHHAFKPGIEETLVSLMKNRQTRDLMARAIGRRGAELPTSVTDELAKLLVSENYKIRSATRPKRAS